MARLVKSSISPLISIVIQTFLNDGTVKEVEYKVGDMITDIRYIENQEIKTATGKLSKINFTNMQTVRNYGSPSTVRSFFADDVIADSIELDCSAEFESNVITIPCNEIIENSGVENVIRMRVYMKFGARFTSFLTDMDENDFTIWEGEDIHNLVYMDRGRDVVSDVRLVAYTYDANLVPLAMVVIENGAVKTLDVMAIKDMADIIHVTEPTDDLNTALSNSVTGVVSIADGTVSTPIALTKNSTIRGAYYGISAVARKKDPTVFKNETILAGTVTVPEGVNLVLDGVTLTKDSKIVVSKASSLELKNVILENMTPSGNNSFVIHVLDSTTPTKLILKNCYFGNNGVDASGNKFKNILELTGPLADGSMISGCYFARDLGKNNIVCLYQAADGANITVRDCTFEYSANAVRVGTMGDVTVNYEFINNTYMDTIEGDYAGFLLIQPYGTRTISMAKNVIRITGLKNETDSEQVYYVYYNDSDTHMTPDKLPTLILEGEVVMSPTPVED